MKKKISYEYDPDYTFKENTHTLKFGRHVSDTPYPSSVSGCLQVTKTKYAKGDRKL